ncbi:MAG: hypothetical protein HRT55_07875 [Colwellia sp.]|uniref:hypothetical protein n=1 Tax=Alteromonadales TaxID=135622 RepID=UPI001DA40BFD|nr:MULTISPECIES: hypothetical protein [Alteromonadales]NQZ26217.1 hypothetical protein [Colwellia sp.]NRA80595.1 hypothetical protein [Pseudoalteromonas sp.]
MDDKSSATPEYQSDEFNAINALVFRTVREAQQLQTNITFDTLMKQPAICELMDYIERQIKSTFESPSQFINQLIQIEYQDKEFWTLHEATCLSCGFDPFLFKHFAIEFPIIYHERYDAKFQSILRFMKPLSVEFMVPEVFCKWALDHDIAHESVTDFFQDIKHRY